MQITVAISTLFMGLAGGPHCVAMCGAACAGISQASGQRHAIGKFQTGRVIGYAALGALSATSVQGLGWLSSHVAALKPLWTFFHVAMLGWGVILLVYARQPLWVDGLAQSVWQKIRPLVNLKGGLMLTGMLWALMPCGLLYSALLIASISGAPVIGALNMATFAIGSAFAMWVGPWVWLKLKRGQYLGNQTLGMRLSGLLLMSVAAWAIWMDVMHQTQWYCSY